jgi:hypothetical protein
MFAIFAFASNDSLGRKPGQPTQVHIAHRYECAASRVGEQEVSSTKDTVSLGSSSLSTCMQTYRRFEVGADATEASAASPGREVLKETDPGKLSR